MAAPVFTEAEYADPPYTGLETRDADGAWLGCTAYTHAARGSVVLRYGDETYACLDGGYRWGAGGTPPGGPRSGAAPALLDGDGDVVPVRWAVEGGRHAPSPVGAASAAMVKQPSRRFLPFDEALAAARSLGLASREEWCAWCKEGVRPPNVPFNPDRTYKDHGWQGWGHWLNSSNLTTKLFLPFGEALAVARSLGLASAKEWKVLCKEGMCPSNVPRRPDQAYKDHGWQGWGHWLNSSNLVTKQFLPFVEALAVARSLGLPGRMEWEVWRKEGLRPTNVPSAPNKVYKDHGWQGWGHWLGTGKSRGGQAKGFLPFAEALRAARQLRLVSQKEWQLWCRTGARPANMPAAPDKVYVHDGWMGWVHWLCHANLGPPTTPALAPTARKRAAPGRTAGSTRTPGRNGGKRQRR